MGPKSELKPDCVTTLTEIWRQVLGKPELDENSDIFQCGGSSMHVLQITGHIYDTLGLNVELRDAFAHSSPRRLADFLDDAPER